MRLAIKAVIVCFAPQIFIATLALSADFELDEIRYGVAIVTLDGPIEQGDAERFRTIMQEAILTPGIDRLVVSLDSPGGNVGEAIEIGRIVRTTLVETWTAYTDVWPRGLKGKVEHLRNKGHKQAFADLDEPLPALSKCWSACTIIFYSGVERQVFNNSDHRTNDVSRIVFYPTIGVHRPRYDPNAFGQLSPAEAQEAYNQMLGIMSDALAGFGAPDEFISKTMATPSSEIDLIPEDEMERLVSRFEPFFVDWIEARCGQSSDVLSETESAIYERYSTAYSSAIDVWENGFYTGKLHELIDSALVNEFGLSGAVRAMEIAEKASRFGDFIDFCEEITVRTVRHEWATEAR